MASGGPKGGGRAKGGAPMLPFYYGYGIACGVSNSSDLISN